MKTVIVIPHHLPTLNFIDEWKQEFNKPEVEIIIVEDKPRKETSVPYWLMEHGYSHYSHADIDEELGKKAWIISRGTSAIRSFGLYKAWQRKPDMIVTLDNDCFPDRTYPYFLEGHEDILNQSSTLDWFTSSVGSFLPIPSRGFPYKIRNSSKTYVNHGLWSNIPDLDAAGMLLLPKLRTNPVLPEDTITMPRFNFYPMCGMNLAFRPEVTPLMYFGLQGPKYGFDQFDDIWAGVFSKKVMDHLGWAVRSGYPSVEHRKQSNAFVNFKKQAGGMERNETLWQEVQKVQLTKDNPIDCYTELITALPDSDAYMAKLKKATLLWLSLFK